MSNTKLLNLLGELIQDNSDFNASFLISNIEQHPDFLKSYPSNCLPRAIIAQALNLLLFAELLINVPEGKAYVMDKTAAKQKISFDHGALRTVCFDNQALPKGHLAFARIFKPLGFKVVGEYPLEKLHMCGFVYCHEDYPEHLAQFFVSELYPESFSSEFQVALNRTLSSTTDPLDSESVLSLNELEEQKTLNLTKTLRLLPTLVSCFKRQHDIPSLKDYETFLDESAEMAWIATEGNAFNHATDRVPDLVALQKEQQNLGCPIKPKIEFASHAKVKQTAYRATTVQRRFTISNGDIIEQPVPGSFFEFIERGNLEDGRLDLRFDSRNAQGIFKMTQKEI